MRPSPLRTAQLMGARPRYAGRREPCMLNAPSDAIPRTFMPIMFL